MVTWPLATSTATLVTPSRVLICSRTDEAQCPQVIPVTVTVDVLIAMLPFPSGDTPDGRIPTPPAAVTTEPLPPWYHTPLG